MASVALRSLLIAAVTASAVITTVATSAHASSSNAPDFYLGMKGAVSCNACHSGAAVNTGGGAIRIEGIPQAYTPGEKYTVRVTIAQPGFKKWGFMMSATGPDGDQAGRFISDDPQVDLKVSSGVTFVKQSFNGTDSLGAARTWTLQWKAPQAGAVTFSAQGIAANGSGHVLGDFSYSTSTTTSPAAPSAD